MNAKTTPRGQGTNSVVLGLNCMSSHNNCVVIGSNLDTDFDNQVKIGNKEVQVSRIMTSEEFMFLNRLLMLLVTPMLEEQHRQLMLQREAANQGQGLPNGPVGPAGNDKGESVDTSREDTLTQG